MVEFFNEEDGEEETLVVTMTLESLNARFASLGATPVVAAEIWTAFCGIWMAFCGTWVAPVSRQTY